LVKNFNTILKTVPNVSILWSEIICKFMPMSLTVLVIDNCLKNKYPYFIKDCLVDNYVRDNLGLYRNFHPISD
jgi:hypothetical protein